MSGAALPGKAARNEQRKLKATTLNAVGLASFGFGVLSPVFAGDLSLELLVKVAAGAALCYILHERAQAAVADLED